MNTLSDILIAWTDHYGWLWMLVGWVVVVIAKEAGR